MLIGSHVSFRKNTQLVGSVEEALSYGSNTFMFYVGAPQNIRRSEIDDELTLKADLLMKENGIDKNNVVCHAPYIVNFANNSDLDKYNFYINFLKEELARCSKLGIKKIVLHPGSHVGLGVEKGSENIIKALNEVLVDTDVVILLETMAGKGSEVGRNFSELKTIIDGVVNKSLIGVCLDTCHLNDSGYDISNFDDILDEFDKTIGLSMVGCVHVNDSKNVLGAGKDRHENIGFGKIGFDSLMSVFYNERLKDVPKILETPYVEDNAPYKEEIEMIRNKVFKEELIYEVKNKSKN